MTQLPISSTMPQTASATGQDASASLGNDAQDSSIFSDMLARQLSPTLNAGDVDTIIAATAGVSTAEITDPALIASHDANNSSLPGEMLAALLAQSQPLAVMAAKQTSPSTSATQPPLQINAAASNAASSALTTVGLSNLSAAHNAIPTATMTAMTTAPSHVAIKGDADVRFDTQLTAASKISFADTLQMANQTTAPGTTLSTTMQGLLPTGQTTAAFAQSNSISTPVGQPQWGNEFGQKITWLTTTGPSQMASLQLNPPDLGPLEVILKVSGDQATAIFASPHAAVRDAIEQALPRLRDMMADSGITLGNTTVSDQAAQEQSGSHGQDKSSSLSLTGENTVADETASTRVSPIPRHNGIVDTFA